MNLPLVARVEGGAYGAPRWSGNVRAVPHGSARCSTTAFPFSLARLASACPTRNRFVLSDDLREPMATPGLPGQRPATAQASSGLVLTSSAARKHLCVPSETLDGRQFALAKLNLAHQGIVSLGGEAGALNFPHVRCLLLDGNPKLASIATEELSGLTSLITLGLAGCGLQRLCDLTPLTNLQQVDMSGNALVSLEATPAPQVIHSDADGDGAVPVGADADTDVSAGAREGTRDGASPPAPAGEPFVFAVPSALLLLLNRNRLRSFAGMTTAGFRNLVRLEASGNRLMSLSLPPLPHLRELVVSHNALTTLEGLQHCPSLRVLNADHNRITTLDLGLGAAVSTWAGRVARKGPAARIDVSAVLAQAQAAAAARRKQRAAGAAEGDEEGEEGGAEEAEGRAEEELLAGLFAVPGEADAEGEEEDGVEDSSAPRKPARLPLSAAFTSGFAFDDWAEERAFESQEARAAAAAVRGGSLGAGGAGGSDDKDELAADSSIAARWPLAQLALLSLRHNKLPEASWGSLEALRPLKRLVDLRVSGNPLWASEWQPQRQRLPRRWIRTAASGVPGAAPSSPHEAVGLESGEDEVDDDEGGAAGAGDAEAWPETLSRLHISAVGPLEPRLEVLLRLPQLQQVEGRALTADDRRRARAERGKRAVADAVLEQQHAEAEARAAVAAARRAERRRKAAEQAAAAAAAAAAAEEAEAQQ